MVDKEKISEFMKEYVQLAEQIKKLEEQQFYIRELVKNYMKQNANKRMVMDGSIALMSENIRETVNKMRLRQILNTEQYHSVIDKKEYTTVRIMSEQSYDNMMRVVKKNEEEIEDASNERNN
jgi:hypothetical protein